MTTLAVALVWCVVQVTLMSLLAAGLYLVLRRFRPAAATSVVFASLLMVVLLSLMAFSPWPRWTFDKLFQSDDESSIAAGASIDGSGGGSDSGPGADRLKSDANLTTKEADKNSLSPPLPSSPRPTQQGRDSTVSNTKRAFQSLVAEISQTAAAGSTGGWRWPEVVAIVLLAAMGFGLLWLVAGMVAVRRQGLRSRPVDDRPLLELVDVLRAELSCLRPIEIRESDELVTAATIGWRRPVVLLPRDWTSWTGEQCRAVLAHEIAHARSHDFLALLCGQIGLMLHFYHPAVHWLVNRMRLEQELAADAAAARIAGGQRQYLTTIAELALSQQDRPLLWPARTFLPTRNTFLRRIAMLRDSKLNFERLSPFTRVVAVGVILAGGLLVAGLRGPASAHPATADDAVDTATVDETAKRHNSENILENPGMENGETQVWTWAPENLIEGVEYSWDREVAFDGKASLSIEKTVNRYFPIAEWSQTVDRQGDLPFVEVSAQVKAKKAFKATLDVLFLGKDDQWISHEWASYIGAKKDNDPPADHDWKKYSGTVKIPPGTVKIRIGLQDYGPGKVWFDDVQVRYVKSKSPAAAGPSKSAESDRDGIDKNIAVQTSARDNDSPSSSGGSVQTLSHCGDSSTEKMSWADSGYAVLFERPTNAKSIYAVRLYGSRYGTPRAPAEKFHIYLLDEKQKVLEHILVPYAKVQRGEMKWFTFEFPAIEVPEKFYVAFWFDAEATKGVYVGKDPNKTDTHSWTGLPDTGYHPVEEGYEWMIRAEVSDESGKKPTYPKVKTYEGEDTTEGEVGEISAKRTWNDATGAFSLEGEFVGLKDGKVTIKKTDGKVITIALDKLSKEDQEYAAKQSDVKKPESSLGGDVAKELSHDDGKMADKRSIGGGGYGVRFEVDSDSYYVTSVSLHGSRYGEPRPPQEDFNVWICDDQFQPIATFHFPYSSYARAAPVWKSFKIKPTKVPEKFIVCFGFNAHQTKGVYVSYDNEPTTGSSLVGVPGQGEPQPFDRGDWLIRCKVEKRSEK
jgi:beta-lactamase regulating signal transducer with metallopeptidase domain